MEQKNIPSPSSCDTFVVLPPATTSGVIFGKNSDRLKNEVQEVVFYKAADHGDSKTLQCTYIEIEQVSHTHAVILSKPSWLWGAEMGANEHNVCIGNEAVWTKLCSDQDIEEKLLGMDLVRLGLERSKTAREALDVITGLLERYGQGGPCSEEPGSTDWCYQNSFIIADSTEAWVLETAAQHWAAEKITSGVRNISNLLSIHENIDLMSDGLKDLAKEKGYWDGVEAFNFAKAFGTDPIGKKFSAIDAPSHRFECGKKLIEDLGSNGDFSLKSMFTILRDQPSGICRVGSGDSATTASQVSHLQLGGARLSSHWFTATPNPACSVFKPFVFCSDISVCPLTVSPSYGSEDPVKVKPRFQKQVDRKHKLYAEHQKIHPMPGDNVNSEVLQTLQDLETRMVDEMQQVLTDQSITDSELGSLFKDTVESEIKFYYNC